jgi:histidinol dehydrogenase
MKIYLDRLLTNADRTALCLRPSDRDDGSITAATTICKDVQARGDAALIEYTKKFDGIKTDLFKVSQEEMQEARRQISPTVMQALETAARNIRAFHSFQTGAEPKVETMEGVVCWRERRAIESVGLYIPAGSAPLPSTVLMLGIPATLAECKRIVLCSPPTSRGGVSPSILAAADLIGISEVYALGGAQAIAALAYGTESIPKVDKIFGPGNKYVTAAKRYVTSQPGGPAIDVLAGPSELLVVADDTANAALVAADLLSQAEHDPFSQVGLVTTSERLAREVHAELPRLLEELPRRAYTEESLGNSFMLICDSLDAALRFSNQYAPEHLIINTQQPEELVPHVHNAGSVFLGSFAPVTAGDYASGTNHTLPTGGESKVYSGVSVESFQKMIMFQFISRTGLKNLSGILTTLAEMEGLEAHKRAVLARWSS